MLANLGNKILWLAAAVPVAIGAASLYFSKLDDVATVCYVWGYVIFLFNFLLGDSKKKKPKKSFFLATNGEHTITMSEEDMTKQGQWLM